MNHSTLEGIQSSEYLFGVVLKVYFECSGIPEEYWDTADVYIEELGLTQYNVPIFYHCTPNAEIRHQNRAMVNAARGFMTGDRVILLCKMQTAQVGEQLVTDVILISHENGIKKCMYNYVIVRASLSPIKPFKEIFPDPMELVTVYDVIEKKVVTNIVDEDLNPLIFPCPAEKLLSFLEFVEFQGVELFEFFPQGDDDIQVAGVIPNWTEDVNGENLRGEEGNWWTSYNYYGNPLQNFFQDVGFAIVTDSEGAGDGSFSKAMEIVEEHEDQIATWDKRSNAFRTDDREYKIKGVEPQYDENGVLIFSEDAIATDGSPLNKATSRHIQTAYGENELWACIVSSYQGIIVSYCNNMTKFVRWESLPSTIAIPEVTENWLKVKNDAVWAMALPGSMGTIGSLADIGIALAADISLAGLGGENSEWSFGILKRINEGSFHRTIHPAITGSYALRTTAISEDTEDEPRYFGALNHRWDKINSWYRYDNWQNTYNLLFATFGVGVIWWFKSRGMEWGAESIYADTPIGSMWLQAPNWKSAVWSMPEISVSTMIARRDYPLNQQLLSMTKHSRTVVCQLYVVQRTSVTLWAEQDGVFIKQELGKGPYHSIPLEGEIDAISYIKMPNESLLHINDATNEDIESVLSDRAFIFTNGEDENLSLKSNRNEFEIMGAADMYGDLKEKHTRRNPMDQERTPEFEQVVADLIDKIMDTAETAFDEVFLDMEIV